MVSVLFTDVLVQVWERTRQMTDGPSCIFAHLLCFASELLWGNESLRADKYCWETGATLVLELPSSWLMSLSERKFLFAAIMRN